MIPTYHSSFITIKKSTETLITFHYLKQQKNGLEIKYLISLRIIMSILHHNRTLLLRLLNYFYKRGLVQNLHTSHSNIITSYQ